MLEADSAECSPWVEGRFCRMATRSGVDSAVMMYFQYMKTAENENEQRTGNYAQCELVDIWQHDDRRRGSQLP